MKMTLQMLLTHHLRAPQWPQTGIVWPQIKANLSQMSQARQQSSCSGQSSPQMAGAWRENTNSGDYIHILRSYLSE